jgi:hypothetical protein
MINRAKVNKVFEAERIIRQLKPEIDKNKKDCETLYLNSNGVRLLKK